MTAKHEDGHDSRFSDRELIELSQRLKDMDVITTEWRIEHEKVCANAFTDFERRLVPLERAFIKASVPLWIVGGICVGALAWLGEKIAVFVVKHLNG